MGSNALLLDRLCKRYSRLPSEVMGISGDQVLSFQLDMAIMAVGVKNENEQHKRAADRGDPLAAHAKLKQVVDEKGVETVPFQLN